jgi:hypothetical protein
LERLRVQFLKQPSAEPTSPARSRLGALPRWMVSVVAAALVLAALSIGLWRTWPWKPTVTPEPGPTTVVTATVAPSPTAIDTPTPTGSIRISRVWPPLGTTLSQSTSVTVAVNYSLSTGEGELGLELILFASPDCSDTVLGPTAKVQFTPLPDAIPKPPILGCL